MAHKTAHKIDLLEDRIADLERKIFGCVNPSSSDIPSTPVTETLIQTSRTLNSATAGHEKTANVLKRLKELGNLAEMSCEDSSTAAKMEIVLVKEADIQSNLSQLEQVRRLATSVLDDPQATENLKGVDNLSGRLDKLSLLTVNNLDEYNALKESVQELFTQYNTIVNGLSRSFLLSDELISAKEASASATKVLD